jgi:tetratricopeptide (TPR) repeat protein
VSLLRNAQTLFSRGRRLLQEWLLPVFDYLAHRSMRGLDYTSACIAFRIVIEIKPTHICASRHLAHMFVSLGRTGYATEAVERWINNCPEDLDARLILVQLLTTDGRTSEARCELERILAVAPRNPDVLTVCGVFYRGTGDLRESSEFLKSSLAERETAGALCELADNRRDENSIEEAVSLLERAIALDPDRAQGYYSLARTGYYKDIEHKHIYHIKTLLRSPKIDAPERSLFNFTLGDVCDQLGLWDQAFAHFDAGNEVRRRNTNINIKRFKRRIDERIIIFNKEYFYGVANSSPSTLGRSLIFIVGMPRSGSTLVEQILASHPSVYVGGERADIPLLVTKLQSELAGSYPASIRQLQPELASRLATEYLASVKELAGGRDRFVDKGLANFVELGLIITLFPGARIVHCRRNPADTCLSCFTNNLVQIGFSCDLNAAALVYREYERMMSHWHSVLPGRILDVRYEDVVRSPEPEIRKLLAFCDLSWEPACLSHHRTKRVVLTASANQVRLPIYGTSVGRWRRYEAHLGGLIKVLGPDRLKA